MTRVFILDNETNPVFAVNDRIFLGEGLFETLRVFKGKPCYPKAHWQRLQNAASFLNLSFELNFASWLAHLNHCISLHKLEDGGIKVILSGGSAPRGLLACGKEPQLAFHGFHYEKKNCKPLA